MTSPNNQDNQTTWVQIRNYFSHISAVVQLVANLVGFAFSTFYFIFLEKIDISRTRIFQEITESLTIFMLLVLCGIFFYRRWFGDIATCMRIKIAQQEVPPNLLKQAQKKVLNIPFATSSISLANWTVAAIIVPLMHLLDNDPSGFNEETCLYSFSLFAGILMGGIITSSTIFFIMENYSRKYLHHFFPKGDLVKVKGVFRLNLRLRIMITFVFASFIPIIDVALVSYSKAKMMLMADPTQVLHSLQTILSFALIVDLSMAFIFSHLLAKIIVKPVMEMKNAMEKVEKGDLSANVKVRDTNELGILGNNFNKMTEGLRERYQIKQSLALARDVQQSLLPKRAPAVEGLDIAGRIIYSDETGGDYYDYICPMDSQGVGVVIGDVSEHGIPSAILMASTRAFIRQRAALKCTLSTLINDVNCQFSRDVEDSGHFMTLFFLSIELETNTLKWVRAGHAAGILFNPLSDTFEELKGKGVALGINSAYRFRENIKLGFEKNQIIVLGTDGLWEAVNQDGEMFGKDRIREMIRQHRDKSAEEIVNTILQNVETFAKTGVPDDDITLVVIKRT